MLAISARLSQELTIAPFFIAILAMPDVVFEGFVLPDSLKISAPSNTFHWVDEARGVNAIIGMTLENSQIRVTATVDDYQEAEFVHLYICVFTIVRVVVNTISLVSGYGFTVHFSQIIEPSGNTRDLHPADLNVASLSSELVSDGLGPLLDLILKYPDLYSPLHDLIEILNTPYCSPVNAARVIEGLRNLIDEGDGSRDEAWKKMRNSLNLTKEFLQFVTDNSKEARHGRNSFLSGEITNEMTRRAWVTMIRFLHFHKSGSNPLPIEDFPLI